MYVCNCILLCMRLGLYVKQLLLLLRVIIIINITKQLLWTLIQYVLRMMCIL